MQPSIQVLVARKVRKFQIKNIITNKIKGTEIEKSYLGKLDLDHELVDQQMSSVILSSSLTYLFVESFAPALNLLDELKSIIQRRLSITRISSASPQ